MFSVFCIVFSMDPLRSEIKLYYYYYYYYYYYIITTILLARSQSNDSFTQVTPVQRHGSSCRSFSGPALSTMYINIGGYSQAKAEIVSTFAHDYDIVYMQDRHIGPEYCPPSIHGMKLIAETRHMKYGYAVYAKPTLNIDEVHTAVTDSQIELITVKLAKITITSVYKPPASEFEWPSPPERCRRPLHLVIGDFNSHSTAWGYEQNDCNGDRVEAWAEASNLSLKTTQVFLQCSMEERINPDVAFVRTRIASMCRRGVLDPVPRTVLSQSPSHRQSLPRIALSEDGSTY